jgi:hypothetical protein
VGAITRAVDVHTHASIGQAGAVLGQRRRASAAVPGEAVREGGVQRLARARGRVLRRPREPAGVHEVKRQLAYV